MLPAYLMSLEVIVLLILHASSHNSIAVQFLISTEDLSNLLQKGDWVTARLLFLAEAGLTLVVTGLTLAVTGLVEAGFAEAGSVAFDFFFENGLHVAVKVIIIFQEDPISHCWLLK